MALTNTQLVTELYIGYFNRAPDPVGLNVWVNFLNTQLNSGVPFATVAADFVDANSALGVAHNLYPLRLLRSAVPCASLIAPDPGTAMGFVNAVYTNLLNRVPDAAGLAFWSGLLDTGQITVGNFILDVLNSVNQQSGTPDALTLANKVTVGDFYATTVATLNAQFTVAAATAAIAGVNATPASVTAAEALITATVAHITFTLTAGADIVTDLSGIGHDIVNAPLVTGVLGLTVQSLSVGDQITLTGDNNVANITLGGTIGSTSWPVGTVLNLGTGVANTVNFSNVGSILPISGILPGLIPANDVVGANIINDNNSVADVLILGVPGIIGTSGLMTVPTAINMNNTGVTAFAVQVDTTQLNGTQTANLGVNGVGIIKPGVVVQEGSEGTLYGGLTVGSNVPGTPGFGTFKMAITGNNAVALGNNGSGSS